jgi:uncharacterized protein with gpF-like domain
MADKLDRDNDKLEKEILKRIKDIYTKADLEIQDQYRQFTKDWKHNVDFLEMAMQKAEKTGDKKLLAELQYEYKRIMLNGMNQDTRFRNMLEQTKQELLHANETALAFVNGQMKEVYALNANGETSRLIKDAKIVAAKMGDEEKAFVRGVSWELVNPNTVRNIVVNGRTLLPYKEVDGVKYERWATKKINAEMLQGIIRGEGLRKLADRLQNVSAMDLKAAIRNARTMYTSAQNSGRLTSMEQAAEKGIILKKVWRSVEDERTRESHILLDGETQPLDEEFSNGLMYPGDPDGEPEEVYNCRCSMDHDIEGFETTLSEDKQGVIEVEVEGEEQPAPEIKPEEPSSNNPSVEQALQEQMDLIEQYGSLSNMMLNGSSEELSAWSAAQAVTGKSDKDVLAEMSADAAHWEKLIGTQTEEFMQPFMDQLLGVATEEEISALRLWTGETYADINRYLRYGITTDEVSRKAALDIERALSKTETPEDLYVKRGTGTRHILDGVIGDWRQDPALLIGHDFSDAGFTATTPLASGGFSGVGQDQAELFIHVPKGTHGAYIADVSHNGFEKEFLLQRGYSYRIVRAEYRENKFFPEESDLKIWCEVIPNE